MNLHSFSHLFLEHGCLSDAHIWRTPARWRHSKLLTAHYGRQKRRRQQWLMHRSGYCTLSKSRGSWRQHARVCVYVRERECVCVCLSVWMCVYEGVCIYMCMPMYMCVCVCMYVSVCMCVWVCVCVCVCVRVCVCVCQFFWVITRLLLALCIDSIYCELVYWSLIHLFHQI